MKEIALQELTWKQAREAVRKVNPKLADVIDKVSPDDSYTLFKASYPYGSQILQKGKLFLPTTKNGLVSLDDPAVDPRIQKSIGYNLATNPVTMVLHNTLDLFVTLDSRIINYAILAPGNIFGLWRILDYPEHHGFSYAPISLWDMTAGARRSE